MTEDEEIIEKSLQVWLNLVDHLDDLSDHEIAKAIAKPIIAERARAQSIAAATWIVGREAAEALHDRAIDVCGFGSDSEKQADYLEDLADAIRALTPPTKLAEPADPVPEWVRNACARLGDRVTKKSGSSWTGRIVGFYQTALTPLGFAVESENESGSVQIYPEIALTPLESGEAETGRADRDGWYGACHMPSHALGMAEALAMVKDKSFAIDDAVRRLVEAVILFKAWPKTGSNFAYPLGGLQVLDEALAAAKAVGLPGTEGER